MWFFGIHKFIFSLGEAVVQRHNNTSLRGVALVAEKIPGIAWGHLKD